MNSGGVVGDQWELRCASNIWKLLPAEGRIIAGEERDPRNKTVSFFAAALDDGRLLWKDRSQRTWWTGMEAVHGGMMFLHEYPVPSMPDHKKIFAIDLRTGDPLWKNDDLSYAFARGRSVYGSRERFDRREFFELDARTGAVGREIPPAEIAALRDGREEAWGADVDLPGETGELPEAVRAAFPPGTAFDPGGSLSYGGMAISSWYERPGGATGERNLREHLFVLDAATGAVIHREVVCDGLSLPAGATFFRMENRIVYVRDRTRLRSFSIGAGGVS